jgi:hypothetical protein
MSEAKLTSILHQAGNERTQYKLKEFKGSLPPKHQSQPSQSYRVHAPQIEDPVEDDDQDTGSRRPKQVPADVWDTMEEEQKMQAVKKYNPALYQRLLEEEQEEEEDDQEYVSRRPPEVDKDEWNDMSEEEKQQVIDYYASNKKSHAPPSSSSTHSHVQPPQVSQASHGLHAPHVDTNTVKKITKQREEKKERDVDVDQDEQPDDSQPASKYKFSNLIDFFNKFDIRLLSVFNIKKRIKLLLISVESFNVCVYMPSKYEMYMERPIGIATYELQEDDDEEEQDTLFYNRLPIESMKREKSSKVKSLMRFLPLVTESPIKTMYIGKYFLSYINRDNEIDSYLCNSPVTDTGYYYMIDLTFLFSHIKNISGELLRFESAFNNAVYDRLTTEVEKTKANLTKAIKKVQNIQPQAEKKTFSQKLAKLYVYLKQDKHKEKANAFLIDVRQKNLNNMFDIENVTYVMKEFK